MRLNARQHAEARQHLERAGCAGRLRKLAAAEQLLIDLLLLRGAQAVRHLDDANAVDECLVGTVVLETLPLGLV